MSLNYTSEKHYLLVVKIIIQISMIIMNIMFNDKININDVFFLLTCLIIIIILVFWFRLGYSKF